MPVTVRSSKKFYDTWREELAQDLVDWCNQVLQTELQAEFQTGIARLKAELTRLIFGFWMATLVPLAELILCVARRAPLTAVNRLTGTRDRVAPTSVLTSDVLSRNVGAMPSSFL